MSRPTWLSRDRVWVTAALLGPPAVCVALVPFRDSFANTNAALLLVLVIVTVASSGNRTAGILAAVSAAVWFDFFLTEPYQRFTITDQADIETAVLLLAVGVGVSELARWGRRQQALAIRHAAYLDGIRTAAEAVTSGRSPGELVDEIAVQLTRVLGLRSCRFQYGAAGLGQPARLRHDGQVEWKRTIWDVERKGLPVDGEIELLVESGGLLQGRYLLDAPPGAHPALAQRLVAVTLATQVGASLK